MCTRCVAVIWKPFMDYLLKVAMTTLSLVVSRGEMTPLDCIALFSLSGTSILAYPFFMKLRSELAKASQQ